MAFGAPRLSVAFVNLAIVFVGLLLALTGDGCLRGFGCGLAGFGFLMGFLLGSWFRLLPKTKPEGPDWQSGEAKNR